MAKKKSKKCKTTGFVAECVECGSAFMAAAHVPSKCGGVGDHDEHDPEDCCGYGIHKEKREGLVCTDCVFKRNMGRLSR